MDKKHCSYCQVFRPIDQIRHERIERRGRVTNKVICVPCLESRAKHNTLAARAAFGRKKTAENREAQGLISRARKTSKQ